MKTSSYLQDILSTIADQGRNLLPRALRSAQPEEDIRELAAALLSVRGEASGVAIASAHFNLPEGLMLEPHPNGAPNILVANTGNNQVRRVDQVAHKVFLVAGDGTPGIAGAGTARFAGITLPRSLATDRFGNLFIASGFTVRQVLAGADGVVSGDDDLITVYGSSRIDAPMTATACLSGIGVEPGDAGLSIVDVCAGFYVKLSRTAESN